MKRSDPAAAGSGLTLNYKMEVLQTTPACLCSSSPLSGFPELLAHGWAVRGLEFVGFFLTAAKWKM